MKKNKDLWDIQFPKIKNVSPRLLSNDLKGFDPSNPTDVKEWGKVMEEWGSRMKKLFDEKGIPLPEISIISSKKPISETGGIVTKDGSGNVIHRQF